MTRNEFVKQAYLFAVRKSTPPAEGSEKWNNLVDIGNALIGQWQDETNVNWRSLYQKTTLADLVTATDTYALDPTVIRKISVAPNDYIIVQNGDNKVEFEFVNPDQITYEGNLVTRIGDNLVFNAAFDADSPLIGGTIVVPNYGYAPQMASSSDSVPVDNPMWLVYATAAEFVRNDYTRQNQFSNLVAMAQDIMESMKDANKTSHVTTIPRGIFAIGETW